MVNKNFMILGIAAVLVLAVIAAPQVFAGSDNSPSPSIANLSDVIGEIRSSGFAPAAIDVDTNLGGFEPHVSYNPLNPANVVVTQGGSLIISLDSGATFPIGPTNAVVPAGLAGYGICGDDVTTWDSQGRLFWTYLTCSFDALGNLVDLSITVVQVNPATGALVNPPVDITPGIFVDDKPWIAADANVGGANADNLYLIWYRLGNVQSAFFSMSIDQGATWSAIAPISSFVTDGFAWPPHITVAPNGDVYANYPTFTCGQTGTIQVLRDSAGGAQLAAGIGGGFTKNPAFTAGQADVTCNAQAAPTFGVFAPIPQTNFWLQGTAAGYTLADPNVPGKIYVVSNDDPDNNFGNGNDGDVVMATSLDFGVSFAVQTVAAGPGNSLQVMPTAAIDQLGNIAISWYDTQNGGLNGGNNFLLDLYATTSTDGGATFVPPFQVNDNAFDPDLNAPQRFAGPPPTLRIGEYNGIAVTICLAYNDWTGNDAGTNNQEIFFDTFTIANCFIEAEKTWTETDYNWQFCTGFLDPKDHLCYDIADPLTRIQIPFSTANINNPAHDVLADSLDPDGDGTSDVLLHVKNNGRISNMNPGAIYALTTVEINSPLDMLEVEESYGACTAELLELLNQKNLSRNVKVAWANDIGDVTEVTDRLYDTADDGVKFTKEPDAASTKVKINDASILEEGNTVYVLVKFDDQLKNVLPSSLLSLECDNTEEVTATSLGQDESVTAEASLRFTTR